MDKGGVLAPMVFGAAVAGPAETTKGPRLQGRSRLRSLVLALKLGKGRLGPMATRGDKPSRISPWFLVGPEHWAALKRAPDRNMPELTCFAALTVRDGIGLWRDVGHVTTRRANCGLGAAVS